jgi:proteic killer suppression protein
MIVDFKSNKLRKQLTTAAEIKKSFGVNAKRVAQRMDDINASDNLQVLCNIPQANCHPLTGNKDGEWAVDISGNHRIIFIITNDPIPIKEDGGINRILVTDIQIISAQEDYH